MATNTHDETVERATETRHDGRRPSRGQFLRRASAGALGTALLAPEALSGDPARLAAAADTALAGGSQVSDSTHFGRIFSHLPFFGQGMPPTALTAALQDIGQPGGLLDAGDD